MLAGIVPSNGETWREQRTFSHSVLRGFGVGTNTLEQKIGEELSAFVRELGRKKCNSFDPRYLVQVSVSNVICSIVFGTRYQYNDPHFKKYIEVLDETFKVLGDCGPLNVFPFLRNLPFNLFQVDKLQRLDKWFKDECRTHIVRHLDELQPGTLNRDFIDAYLKEMIAKHENDEDTTLCSKFYYFCLTIYFYSFSLSRTYMGGGGGIAQLVNRPPLNLATRIRIPVEA